MKVNVEIEMGVDAITIPEMQGLVGSQYASYVENSLFFMDHHGALRAILGEYPIATTKEQLDILVGYLNSIRAGMPSRDDVT